MLIYWLWLSTKEHVTLREQLAVLEHFGSPEDCYHAVSYQAVEGLRAEAAEALMDKCLDEAEKVLACCAKKHIRLLTLYDRQYPVRLRNIPDPPLVLYYRGIWPDFDNSAAIGVVGTRKATAYGLSCAMQLGQQITQCGGLVVSGMAAGIDAMATEGALKTGKTAVGVLGCGVDRIYPASNRKLFLQMDQQGCLISEYPPGTPPNWYNFPRRNRIISGLSCGVLVVEAPQKSGALITARQALEQGRDVYVVPGNIGVAACEGSNNLLRDGACMATSGWDILSEYAGRFPDKLHPAAAELETAPDKKSVDNGAQPPYSDIQPNHGELTREEEQLLERLKDGKRLLDDIIAETGLSAGQALAALTMLEVSGVVTTLPGGWVSLSEIH